MEKTKYSKANVALLLRIVLPPLIVAGFMLMVFYDNDMYPFGTKTLSWCDMSQQVIPLLNQFKDILDGKDSLFFSFKNSSGMDFYGVFFFFLSSPFSFLVKFVPKAKMMMFANVLVMLKLSVCALTASCCLCYCRRKLDSASTVLLSVMYPFCGYAMMYYQNIIWLDMMYLFPLLVVALTRVTKKQKPLMYIIVLTACVVVNYYISYMVVIMILLFTAVYGFRNRKSSFCSRVCRDIFLGSLISALLTAVVWLPSFVQYTQSARGETGVLDSLASSSMITSYQTVLPMLFCTAFVFVVIFADLASERKRSVRGSRFALLLWLTLIPFFVEPINKMWHTGSYMSFPCRFGFMTVFLAIICAAYVLEQQVTPKKNKGATALWIVICSVAVILCARYSFVTRRNNDETISRFAYTLWGNEASFKLLALIFAVTIITYTLIYTAYRKGYLVKGLFLTFAAAVFMAEAYNNMNIYMTYPAERNTETNEAQSEIYDLADRIDDEDFYRVKSYAKVYNNNLIGAMGYNSISHYTSLNSKDYMYTMKRLGYSGVWMETSSVGGTRLTDALLSVKYEINGGVRGSSTVYRSDAGAIYQLREYLPMGLLLDENSLENAEIIPEDLTRTEVQEYISEHIFGENLITTYSPELAVAYSGGKYSFKTGDTLTYYAQISGEQTLYLDCFDELTNHLKEPIFDAFTVKINDEMYTDSYPVSLNNGVLALGDYEEEEVKIELTCEKDISCASFGVFGLDTARLRTLCENAQGVSLTAVSGGMKGSCTIDKNQTCFVSLPYSSGFTVKVNGKKVEYSRAFSDFLSFELTSGKNEIEISYTPVGFKTGLVMSIIGAAGLVIYIIFRKKLDKPLVCDEALKYIMLAVAGITAAVIYVFPVVINVLANCN